MHQRDFLLLTSGTTGDVLPFCLLGRALAHRGHHVTLLTSTDHAGLADAHGIGFVGVASPDWPQAQRDDRRFWREVVAPSHFEMARHCASRFVAGARPVLLARTENWAAPFVAERYASGFVRIALQPGAIVERARPYSERGGAVLNSMRAELGLPARQYFHHDADYRQPTVSLFPSWFGGSPSAMAQAGFCAGFPFPPPAATAPEEPLTRWAQDKGGIAIFSAGTGDDAVGHLQLASESFHQRTGIATLFLSRHAGPVRSHPSPGYRVAPFADHQRLLEFALLMVHNGGIGTVAQCLRAAVPQIVIPLRYDQPHNARRVSELGLGASIAPEAMSADSIGRAYAALVCDNRRAGRAAAVADALCRHDAAQMAAEHIEALADGPPWYDARDFILPRNAA